MVLLSYGDRHEPPVVILQDDRYASAITIVRFPIFDRARTEALRGQQGTRFGAE